MNRELTRAKHRQAADLLEQHGIDCWVIQFARETSLRPDPLQHLVGPTVTWPSAFLLHASGEAVAIVGSGDLGTVRDSGIWGEVHGYVTSPREELVRVLNRWSPRGIGVTWSTSDHTADGISMGMYRLLESLLEGTPHRDRLVPAGDLAGELRRRKLPQEIEGIKLAVTTTEQMLARLEDSIEVGMTELQLHQLVQAWVREAGHDLAWDPAMNPMVNFGPLAGPMGHALPGERPLQPGIVVHVDLGLLVGGFASDLQRTWYLLGRDESEPPPAVRATFAAVLAAIDAGVEAIRPGLPGWSVDEQARLKVQALGYPEPQFAFGHHLGLVAHDGAGVLGPRWERYGNGPEVQVEAGNVFAVEMDLEVPGAAGLVGLEEVILVTERGPQYLSTPQRELRLLG